MSEASEAAEPSSSVAPSERPQVSGPVGVDAEFDPAVPADAETQASGADESAPEASESSSVEDLVADLERITRERDEYLDTLRRNQAEFENIRKRMIKQQSDNVERAAEALVEKLLPVLDACDGALRHGSSQEIGPIFASLLGILEKEGLERIDPSAGEAFNPNHHEAVVHEPSEGSEEGTVISEVLRAGYTWKGRVVRAAMVKVRG